MKRYNFNGYGKFEDYEGRFVYFSDAEKLKKKVKSHKSKIDKLEHIIHWHDCVHGLDLKELYKKDVLECE